MTARTTLMGALSAIVLGLAAGCSDDAVEPTHPNLRWRPWTPGA